jgi:hypothetical protein
MTGGSKIVTKATTKINKGELPHLENLNETWLSIHVREGQKDGANDERTKSSGPGARCQISACEQGISLSSSFSLPICYRFRLR